MENSLPRVPAHLVSLAGEFALRMRVDTLANRPLEGVLPVSPDENPPLATFDLSDVAASLSMRFGVAPQ
jgi:hypothetical protein